MLSYGKKVKQWMFSETTVVYDIKVGRCSELNEYINLYEYKRSGSFTDLGPRSLRFNIFECLFLRNRCADSSQISCGASMGIESLFKNDQPGRHANIW